MDFDALAKHTNYQLPLDLIHDVSNLEIRQSDLEGDDSWVWVCGENASERCATPLNALLNFLNESTKLWGNDEI